jgi:K+-sensing histidine kinase KdpD
MTADDSTNSASDLEAQFIQRTAHDLLQPAHALGLLVAAAKASAPDANLLSVILGIEEASGDLTRVLKDFLALARLNGGEFVPTQTEVALKPLVASIQADPALANSQIGFVGSTAALLADSTALTFILQRLILHAIRFSPDQRTVVGCRTKPGGSEVEVWRRGPLAEDVAALIAGDASAALEAPRATRDGFDLSLFVAGRMATAANLRLSAISRPGLAGLSVSCQPVSDAR